MPKPESTKPLAPPGQQKKRKRTGGPLDNIPRFSVRHAGRNSHLQTGESEDIFDLIDGDNPAAVYGTGTEEQIKDWIVAHYSAQLRQLAGIMCARSAAKPKHLLAGRHVTTIHQSWIIERTTNQQGKRVMSLRKPDGTVVSSGELADMMVPMLEGLVADAEPKVRNLMTDLFPTKN